MVIVLGTVRGRADAMGDDGVIRPELRRPGCRDEATVRSRSGGGFKPWVASSSPGSPVTASSPIAGGGFSGIGSVTEFEVLIGSSLTGLRSSGSSLRANKADGGVDERSSNPENA
jgi:hypothetical protein